MKKIYDDYYITENGELWSNKRKTLKKLTWQVDRWGYLGTYIVIEGRPKYVIAHRLVAEAYIENPNNKPHVNHIDGNKTNNHVSNLEWVTVSENTRHSLQMGKQHNPLQGVNANFGKYSDADIITALTLIINGVSISQASKQVGMSTEGLRKICTGQTRKYIWDNLPDEVHDWFKSKFKWNYATNSAYSDEQLIAALLDIESGMSKAAASRKHQVSINVIRHVCSKRSRLDIWEKVNQERCRD